MKISPKLSKQIQTPLPTIRNTKTTKIRTRKIEAAHSETLPI